MVTRKPVPPANGSNGTPPAPSAAAPLVPVPDAVMVTAPTPTSPPPQPLIPSTAPPPVPWTQAAKGKAPAVRPPNRDYDSDSENEWDSEEEWEMADREDESPKQTIPDEVPAPLRISRPSSANSREEATHVPAVLRVGPPGGIPQQSQESLTSFGSFGSHSNNPWRSAAQTPPRDLGRPPLRPQNTGEMLFGTSQHSSSAWGSTSPQPAGAVAELPSFSSPKEELQRLNLSEPPTMNSPAQSSAPSLPFAGEAPADWMEKEKAKLDALTAPQPITVANDDPFGPIPTGGPESTQVWQDQPSHAPGKQKETVADGFPSGPTIGNPATVHRLIDAEEDEPPPPMPPRPDADVVGSGGPRTDSPNTAMKNQKNQTYQIKNIRWFDDRSKELRVSPILTQNANGPCPLLALVNALSLSTPIDVEAGLVKELSTREQVSLEFLLSAVFDELMSGRRGSNAQQLPDVSDLYSFLIDLHTGMNVNPRFVADPEQPLHGKVGGFEQTREMRLYSTFNVPLLHGWIPEQDSEAYAAFERSAKTYEDAQNIQFYEEELEAKLGGDGLTQEEQNMFEDLISIKQYFSTWPTQLTEYGLQAIKNHLNAGEFAILFRNDHFSTVYKEPKSNSLLTVITDAGYASHDEIVWESLVDINGMRTEHFSGDFRPVSHNVPAEGSSSGPAVGPRDSSLASRPVQSLLDVDRGWTQVQGKNKKRGKDVSTTSQQSGVMGSSSAADSDLADVRSSETGMSAVEQEDADLALALQLQEEEEDRQRRAQADRRNSQLSRQVIEQQASQSVPTVRPPVPARRGFNAQRTFTTNRPAAAEGDAPPPSYEDASKDRRFVPPSDHPASPHAPVSPGGHQRQQSAYMSTNSGLPPNTGRRFSRPGNGALVDQIPGPSRMPNRRNSGVVGQGPQNRDEKCIVM